MSRMPTVALSKTAPKDGTPEWFKQRVADHGSTEPLKLEHRRKKLSYSIAILERTVKMLQDRVKTMLSAASQRQREIKQTVRDAKEQAAALAALREAVSEKVIECNLMQSGLVAQMAMLDAMALIVDCVSLRAPVKEKDVIKGHTRYSLANYVEESSWAAKWTYRLVEEMAKQKLPKELMAEIETEQEQESSEIEVEDGEILTPDLEAEMAKREKTAAESDEELDAKEGT